MRNTQSFRHKIVSTIPKVYGLLDFFRVPNEQNISIYTHLSGIWIISMKITEFAIRKWFLVEAILQVKYVDIVMNDLYLML